jgi:hypothetical protein
MFGRLAGWCLLPLAVAAGAVLGVCAWRECGVRVG